MAARAPEISRNAQLQCQARFPACASAEGNPLCHVGSIRHLGSRFRLSVGLCIWRTAHPSTVLRIRTLNKRLERTAHNLSPRHPVRSLLVSVRRSSYFLRLVRRPLTRGVRRLNVSDDPLYAKVAFLLKNA